MNRRGPLQNKARFWTDVSIDGLELLYADQLSRKPAQSLFFRNQNIKDNKTANLLHSLHAAIEKSKAPAIEKESRMIEALTHLLVRHATPRPFVIQETANRKYVQIANFCDQSQFTKRFKQLVGTTPGHFRNTPQYSTIQRLQLRIIIDLVFADHSYPEGKPCPVLSAWHHA